ncbi:uroporphyrinogen-III C-methyltransferase [Escherichia coli]
MHSLSRRIVRQETLAKQLDEVQQKVATISGSDAKTWLLAQADFLVKLAGRKLWSDQDVTTAAALLKSADASLADMNDPSLITVRRAITDDIASLSAVSQVDYDGIILKLNQLSNQVDNLRLADNDSDGSPMDSDGEELSSSISEWRINLQKSWQNFMDNFITIRRRDDTAVPLLAPKSGYLSARKYSLSPAGRSTSCTASPGRDLSPGAGERLHLGTCLLRY